jgi:predicted MPP superfamily phosphohydrolase
LRRIQTAHGELYLVGIDDAASGHANPAQALRDLPPGHVALCLTHSPDAFPDLPRACLLTIAGHTHGGQVDLPVVGRLIVHSRFGQRFAAGLIHENGRYLFVSTGIGTDVLPVRFRVPPEISILDVR